MKIKTIMLPLSIKSYQTTKNSTLSIGINGKELVTIMLSFDRLRIDPCHVFENIKEQNSSSIYQLQ